jgi:hypothetical protein
MKLQAVEAPVTNEDREWQSRAGRLTLDSLDSIRVVAGRWAATIGSLTGVLGVVALVGGPRSVDQLEGIWRVLIGVLVLLAILAAAWATWSAAGAAQGSVATTLSTYARLRDHYRGEEKRARRLLNRSKIFAVIAMATLVVALAVPWFAPRKSDDILVIRYRNHIQCIPLKDNLTLSMVVDPLSTITIERGCPSR